MKFTSVLKEIILEQSRFEFLLDKFVKSKKKGEKVIAPKMKKEELYKLINADPTSRLNNINLDTITKEELKKVKVGEYTPWLIKQYLNPTTERAFGDNGFDQEVKVMKDRFMEDLYKITDDLKKFHRFKGRVPIEQRDINKLSADELYDAVRNFDLTLATTTKAERKSLPVHPGADSSYDGETWKVVKIEDKGEKGKEAACFYGGNQQETRWCTSAPGLSWFNNYIKDGPLYVVYNPNDPKISEQTGLPIERYQFHFPSNQFMDKDDRSVNLVDLLNGPMAELKQYFKPEFAKGLTAGSGKDLKIDGFSSGSVGKFVGLYGLEELFNSLPDTLEQIKIKNKDNVGTIIDIPPSITRFKNLKHLVLVNCIKNVPDYICQLNNLNILGVMGNPQLTSLPECLGTMENLEFINFKDTGLSAPKSLEANGWSEMETGMWDKFSQDDEV